MVSRDILIDVSRLVWRMWRGRLPTGIDRVCLAYVEHFRDRAEATVQRKGRYYVFGAQHSDRLFELFLRGAPGFRRSFVQLAARAFPAARRIGRKGQLYLNLGHTGLDEPSLASWTGQGQLRPLFLIHDLIPLFHPEFCRDGEYEKHARRMQNALSCAKGIIGNSQATLSDLAKFANSRGLSMPPSIAAFIGGTPVAGGTVPKTFDRPHFVTIGTIEARKNHLLLLHIWRRLVARHGKSAPLLVIAGQRGWMAESAIAMLDRAVDLKGHVLELNDCPDGQLNSLLMGARALLMPSFAEGFGLPVAEALQAGTPVIASNLPVFREFAGDIPTYLDPLDGPGWESAILSFAGDSPHRQRQLVARRGYRAPNWTAHFATIDSWIERLV